MQNQPAQARQKHWYWDSWILLGLSCSISFTLRSLMIGEISALGYEGLYYLALGPIPFGFVYFIYRKEWARRNIPSQEHNKEVKKVISRKWDNSLDWHTFLIVLWGAFLQGAIYVGVIESFKMSRLAGLNIGIASAIWSFLPFFVAFLEKIFFGFGLKVFQFVGMSLLVVLAVLVALSDLFSDNAEEVTLNPNIEHKEPVYKAILYSFIFPVSAGFMNMTVVYTKTNLRLQALDWVQANSTLYGVIGVIIGIFFWLMRPGTFKWKYFVQGFIGGTLTLAGANFIVAALMVEGAPCGPTVALINC